MNETELRALVERMVADLMGQAPTPQVKAADYKPLEDAPAAGTGESLPDITEVDLRKLYLVEHPQNGTAFLDLKAKTPARLGFGRAGARYKTETMLRMRADHAAAQDSVFSWWTRTSSSAPLRLRPDPVQGQDEYLTRPDKGRRFDEANQDVIQRPWARTPRWLWWWGTGCPPPPSRPTPPTAWRPSGRA